MNKIDEARQAWRTLAERANGDREAERLLCIVKTALDDLAWRQMRMVEAAREMLRSAGPVEHETSGPVEIKITVGTKPPDVEGGLSKGA